MTALEVADIFRDQGPAWRRTHAGHISLGQLKVMSAIERCRSAALGGHVLCCESCAQFQIAYNSCRNRHCPKCQATAARRWLEARQADLLPVDYYHLVFTLPAAISDIAYQNKAVIYKLLFKTAAETLLTIAADPKHLDRAREMLQIPPDLTDDSADNEHTSVCVYLCKSCGAPMVIIETFYTTHAARAPPICQP